MVLRKILYLGLRGMKEQEIGGENCMRSFMICTVYKYYYEVQ
jgi:hypothetical protein